MKNIIFLDLDGPMIDLCDSGPHMMIMKEFNYHSKFDEKAKFYLRKLCEEFNAKVVTNSTHNEFRFLNIKRGGKEHIRDIFEINGIGDLLRDNEYRSFFNRHGCRDRVQGIFDWFTHNKLDPKEYKILAFDDANMDFYHPRNKKLVEQNNFKYIDTDLDPINEPCFNEAREFFLS